MSRVLKFRAWVNDHWVDWIPTCKTLGAYNASVIDTDGYTFEEDNPFIVEQYTGLKDKNGKEIYEGDIVRCYSRKKLLGEYQVIWNEDCGGFECESLKPLVDGGDRMLKDVRVFNEISIQFRVIGNIHENPELMKGEE